MEYFSRLVATRHICTMMLSDQENGIGAYSHDDIDWWTAKIMNSLVDNRRSDMQYNKLLLIYCKLCDGGHGSGSEALWITNKMEETLCSRRSIDCSLNETYINLQRTCSQLQNDTMMLHLGKIKLKEAVIRLRHDKQHVHDADQLQQEELITALAALTQKVHADNHSTVLHRTQCIDTLANIRQFVLSTNMTMDAHSVNENKKVLRENVELLHSCVHSMKCIDDVMVHEAWVNACILQIQDMLCRQLDHTHAHDNEDKHQYGEFIRDMK